MLFIHFKLWKHHKTIKTYQEAYGNFSGFLQEILVRAGVQIARMQVQLASNFKKPQKNLKPMDLRPKPTDLMDPDQANAPGALDWSRSIRIWIKRPEKEEVGRVLGRPDPVRI